MQAKLILKELSTKMKLYKTLTCKCIFNLRDIGKMRSVRYSETSHAVRVSPLCEMPLESLRPFVHVISANLAIVTYV